MPRKQTTAVEQKTQTGVVNQDTMKALLDCEKQCRELADMDVGMHKMMAQANAIQQMRQVMNRPDVREAILALKNSPIGFKTDERPAKGQYGDKYYKPEIKYGYNVIVDAVIQGMMLGVYPIQNQMNVLAYSCYVTKEGLEYRLDTDPVCIEKLESKHIENISYLGYDPNTGMATILVEIVFKLKNSTVESKEFKVPVKYHPQTGSPDQAFGKAKRKAWAWLYERVTGAKIPDGDVEMTIDDGDIIVENVESHAAVDEPVLAKGDEQFIWELLKAECFTDKTREDYRIAFENGAIHAGNIEETIGQLTGFIVQKGGEIPKRKETK